MNKKEVKQIADTEVAAHEKRMHGKGFAKGGKTNLDMKKYGRGMAKVMNQRTSSRGR
jgi:hypothetical protein